MKNILVVDPVVSTKCKHRDGKPLDKALLYTRVIDQVVSVALDLITQREEF